MSHQVGCVAQRGSFQGWVAIKLANGLITLAAVPDIGGRIMAYDLGPYPFLFVDPLLAGKLFSPEENRGDGTLAAWKNYGGEKTWPAPQGWDNEGQWHGPPDPVLDTGRYTVEEVTAIGGQARLRMHSPRDERTGLQIARQFTITSGSSRVQVELTFRNVSSAPITWSIWDVVQLRAECRSPSGDWKPDPTCFVTAPLHPGSRFSRGYQVMFGEENNPQWQVDDENELFRAQYLWQIGKVGLDSPGGWVAFSQGTEGYAFCTMFDYVADGQYPDGGASVECWTVGAGQVGNLNYAGSQIYLMETEVLGPLQTIEPGEMSVLELEWGACRCPGPVVDVTGAGCVAQPLIVRRDGHYAALAGRLGAFELGELQLTWIGADGTRLEEIGLGAVDPLRAILLDGVFPLPEGARRAELHVRARIDGQTRLLAAAELE